MDINKRLGKLYTLIKLDLLEFSEFRKCGGAPLRSKRVNEPFLTFPDCLSITVIKKDRVI